MSKAEQIQEAARFSWLGASPGQEPLDEYYSAPAPPKKSTVIASDGSQLYPDTHGIALYYLINVGAIVYQYGSGERPELHTECKLYCEEKDIFDEQGYLIPSSWVNVKRDLGEIEILAKLAVQCPNNSTPCIALIDGQLTLRSIDLPSGMQISYEERYIKAIDKIRQHGAIIAAYIDRPRSSFVVALLHLANLEIDRITETTLRQNPFVSITDADIFDDLKAGERTAVFNQRSKVNATYSKAGHQIHFFYLNVGTNQRPALARIEIPVWVAYDEKKLNELHAIILQQAAITDGYPYVLARADELAVINNSEREALETILAVSLQQHGVSATLSHKQRNKNLFRRK
ncbi:MAG: hypothetical protein B6242_14135 [Anaerolineaceae bacterium 4572_78]|nr:MAG: hypothetical protein B6242_14135 [Anaerolineaceae bacterium 4572_78]